MALAQVSIGDPVVMHPGVYIVHGQVVADGMVEIHAGVVIAPFVTIGLRAGDVQGPTIERGASIGTGAKVIGPVRIGAGAQHRRERGGGRRRRRRSHGCRGPGPPAGLLALPAMRTFLSRRRSELTDAQLPAEIERLHALDRDRRSADTRALELRHRAGLAAGRVRGLPSPPSRA